jgi:DNA-binding response OmpR family regulator
VAEAAGRGARVLIVEDDLDISSLLREVFESEGYAAVTALDARDLDGSLDSPPALVLLDLRLGNGDADDVIKRLRARGLGDVPVLVLSAAPDLAERARKLGAAAYLAKPFELDELLAICRRLM